jgi:CheY-like chemotaxis protein
MNDESLGSVLLVDADPAERRRLGEALEAVGFEVVECPGPTESDGACVGTRTGMCPLLGDVDVVVIDVQLERDDVEFRATSEELLNLYLGSGRPVVTLGLEGRRLDEGGLLRLRRSPDANELVRGVRGLVGATAGLAERRGHGETDLNDL